VVDRLLEEVGEIELHRLLLSGPGCHQSGRPGRALPGRYPNRLEWARTIWGSIDPVLVLPMNCRSPRLALVFAWLVAVSADAVGPVLFDGDAENTNCGVGAELALLAPLFARLRRKRKARALRRIRARGGFAPARPD
jgi:hypothetical protein